MLCSPIALPPQAGNLNLASLAGVMKYLHTEIAWLGTPERKNGISRILRFSVIVHNPRSEASGVAFSHEQSFVAFDRGKCTVLSYLIRAQQGSSIPE